MSLTTNVVAEHDGRPTETLAVPDGTVWRWKIFGYAKDETADLWLETTLTGPELLRLLEPGTDNEEFLGTLDSYSGRKIKLTVATQSAPFYDVHVLTRKNPGGFNSLRWHLKALAVELGQEVEELRSKQKHSGLAAYGERRLSALVNVLEQIDLWPSEDGE